MFYKCFSPVFLTDIEDSEREITSVLKSDTAEFQIASLKKNYEFDTHISDTNVCIYLLDGELEFDFVRSDECSCSECFCKLPGEEGEDKKAFRIKKAQMFMFEKHKPHYVKALKDSVFFIIKI